jgi:hypothetical protein
MRRASTPTHYFELPSEFEGNLEKVLVTYAQDNEIVLEKTEADLTFEGNVFYYTLTQEETNLFQDGVFVEIQIRVKTKDGISVPSDIYKVNVQKVLNDEVL